MGVVRYRGINPDRLLQSSDSGRDFIATPSPYDVPTGIFSKSNADGTLEVVFEYIDREPEYLAAAYNNVQIILGKRSGKVLRLIFPPGTFTYQTNFDELRAGITHAIGVLDQRDRTGEANRNLANEILGQDLELLVKPDPNLPNVECATKPRA